jgi:replicative DNA helicase
MLSSAQRYVAAIIHKGKIEDLFKHGPTAYLFKGHEETLWSYVDGHVRKYGTLPDFGLVKADTGFDLAEQIQPAEFYLDRARENHIQQELIATIAKLGDTHLKPGQGVPSEALKTLSEKTLELTTQRLGAQLHDYRNAHDPILAAFKARLMGGQSGLQLGWPTLDTMTGGLRAGDLISIAARPGQGKTWMLLWAALHTWQTQGRVPLFVSMEMEALAIEQRLIAIQAQLSAKHIRDATLTSTSLKHMRQVLLKTKDFELPFWIVDGNLTSTVSDIHELVQQLKPGVTFVDGGYLLAHPTERNRFVRVAENATLLKQVVCKLCPVVATWQFAKPPKGQKKPASQSGDDIGYSDAIYQLSSLALGLPQPDSVETITDRIVEILKGRSGETGQFRIKWDFAWTTDFSEVVESESEEFETE